MSTSRTYLIVMLTVLTAAIGGWAGVTYTICPRCVPVNDGIVGEYAGLVVVREIVRDDGGGSGGVNGQLVIVKTPPRTKN